MEQGGEVGGEAIVAYFTFVLEKSLISMTCSNVCGICTLGSYKRPCCVYRNVFLLLLLFTVHVILYYIAYDIAAAILNWVTVKL